MVKSVVVMMATVGESDRVLCCQPSGRQYSRHELYQVVDGGLLRLFSGIGNGMRQANEFTPKAVAMKQN